MTKKLIPSIQCGEALKVELIGIFHDEFVTYREPINFDFNITFGQNISIKFSEEMIRKIHFAMENLIEKEKKYLNPNNPYFDR